MKNHKIREKIELNFNSKEANAWNDKSFDEQLAFFKNKFGNDVEEFDMKIFKFNKDNTILNIKVTLFKTEVKNK